MVVNATHKILKEIPDLEASSNVDGLLDLLKHQEPAVRFNAAWALARIGAIEAYAPLIEMLSDPEMEVVRWSVSSLAELDEPRAVVPMVQRLAQDPSPWLGSRVEHAITTIGASRCQPFLLELLPQTTAQGQRTILDLLGHLGDQTALSSLKRFRDRQPETKRGPTIATIQAIEGNGRV